MWIKAQHPPALYRALGRTRAALFTAAAMVSAGIAAVSVNDWIGGNSRAALMALTAATLATAAGVQAFRAHGGTPSA